MLPCIRFYSKYLFVGRLDIIFCQYDKYCKGCHTCLNPSFFTTLVSDSVPSQADTIIPLVKRLDVSEEANLL